MTMGLHANCYYRNSLFSNSRNTFKKHLFSKPSSFLMLGIFHKPWQLQQTIEGTKYSITSILSYYMNLYNASMNLYSAAHSANQSEVKEYCIVSIRNECMTHSFDFRCAIRMFWKPKQRRDALRRKLLRNVEVCRKDRQQLSSINLW